MATNPKRLRVTESYFDDVKANLKTFLKAQNEFTDYNFEGSGMAVLLDLLAYNTHYLGFNMNMLANEMFLDSAALRSSIVSHAKMLGYTPSSPRAPRASIDIKLNNAIGSSVTMVKGTVFSKYKQFVENCFEILPRQALHAKTIGFIHPETKESISFDSKIPNDISQVIDKWKLYSKHKKL